MIKAMRSYMLIIIMGVGVIVSGATLMVVSQDVYDKQKILKTMDREALMTEWEIRALNAELAFLTQPERLEEISMAMAQSISPSSGQEVFMISSVSLNPYAPPRGLSLIPDRKPNFVRRVSQKQAPAPTPIYSPTPQPKKQVEKTANNDFSSMLDNIGDAP